MRLPVLSPDSWIILRSLFGATTLTGLRCLGISPTEILEDSDGDGMPNELPDDYDPTNPDSPVGDSEDLDDDNDDVIQMLMKQTDGTDPTNPDTDGDGMCDGPVASASQTVWLVQMPSHLTTSADTDTDGDGDPDTLVPGRFQQRCITELVEDLDDDGDVSRGRQ